MSAPSASSVPSAPVSGRAVTTVATSGTAASGGTAATARPGPAAGPEAPRLVAVWVPDWPVVALTLEAREQRRLLAGRPAPCGERLLPDPAVTPVAVVGGRGVQAASAPARAAGVAVGARLRTARSLCPGLVVLPPQPEREARAFETVMDALGTLLADPVVARPGLALSGARGPARWLGGEEALAAGLVEAVAEGPGVECQVGVADSLLGAVLAARHGVLVPEGETPAFLAPWPLASLLDALPTRRAREESRDLLETLGRLGLRTLGDLAALPLPDVSARFGPVGERAHLLASGRSHQVPRSDRPASDAAAETALDPPVERVDAAAFAARQIAERLSALLVGRGLAAGRLLVEAACENGAELSRSWMLETTPSAAELTDRVRWQLEGWLSGRSGRPPASALTRLRLTALELVPAGASQAGLWAAPGEQGRRRARRAAERVESLLGAGGVQVPLLVEGRDPRSRARLVAWGEQPSGAGASGQAPARPRRRPGRAPGSGSSTARPGAGTGGAPGAAGSAPWSGALPLPSPSVVPLEPVPVLLTDADGREVLVSAQGQLEGLPGVLELPRAGTGPAGSGPGRRRVVSWAGPWPVDEGWWRPEGASRRAYLQLVTDTGPPLLLVRSGRWWLDAVYS